MPIGPDELERLLTESWTGAAPREATRLQTVIDTIHKANVTADLGSESSAFLRRVIETHQSILMPDAHAELLAAQSYAVPVNFADATARIVEGQSQIFLFEGMQAILHFYVSLIRVMDLLALEHPDYRIALGETVYPASEAAGMAGFSMLADALQTGRELGAIDDFIEPGAFRNAQFGYQGAVLFVLLHELGHIKLGHLKAGLGRSEVHDLPLAYPEEIRTRLNNEFEADAFALAAIKPEMRALFMLNVLFFLGPYAFIETFMAPKGSAHPLAVNRIQRLIVSAGFTDEEARVAAGVVQSYLGMLNRESLKRPLDEDRRGRIGETMPVAFAYKVFDTIRNDLTRHGMQLGQFQEPEFQRASG